MKRIALFSAMLFFFFAANAQKTIKGKIFDKANNTPLAGATITFAGKGGTVSDKNGQFTIECGKTNRITITFVGYDSYTLDIKNCDEELNIGLVATGRFMDDVEITATSNENKNLLYQPMAITKLTATELKRGNGIFLDDAINTSVPGVIMQRRGVSSGQQFNIRGYGNGSRGSRGISSNFDGQGYKVYLNGIPVTDAEGITTLDDIDYGSIGNVEVVKGPSGTLFGLAIAGAINLHTVKPEKGTSVGQEVMIGNYGLKRFTTHFQTATDRSSLLVNYGHQSSDGFTIHNRSHKDFVNVAGDFQPTAKQSVMAYFGYSNSYDQRSGELTIQQYDTEDFSGNIEYIKRDGHSNVFTVRGGLGHTYDFNSHVSNTTSVFLTAFNSNASSAGGWTEKAATNFGVRSVFNTKFDLANGIKLSGITGIESQRQNATTVGYTMVKNPKDTASVWKWGNPYYWAIGAITSDIYAQESTSSLFTEWTLALPKDLSITAGIGSSNMKITLFDRFYEPTKPNKPTRYDTTYNNMWSPHLAINKVFSKQLSAYASYSKGYKAPVSSYFYIPYVLTPANSETGVVNNHLKPEIGNQFEIGTKGNLFTNRLNFQVALFEAIFSQKMTTVAVPLNATTTAYSYVVNGGKQKHKGVEAYVKYNVIKKKEGFFTEVSPFVNFTYSDFGYENYKFQTGTTVANTKTYDFSGYPVVGVSKVVSSQGIDINTKVGLYGNIVNFYRGKLPITSPDTLYASSYNLLNAKLGYRKLLTAHWNLDLSFGVNNIGGIKYPLMVFVNQIPDAYMVGPRKANYFAAIKIDYIF